MQQRHALISKSNQVLNVILFDSDEIERLKTAGRPVDHWQPPDGHYIVALDDDSPVHHRGWTYDKSKKTFVPPSVK